VLLCVINPLNAELNPISRERLTPCRAVWINSQIIGLAFRFCKFEMKRGRVDVALEVSVMVSVWSVPRGRDEER